MSLLAPTPPPYDPLAWERMPFAERARAVCAAWALQGYGAPLAIYAVYALKIVGFVAGWSAFCSFSPGLGGLARLPEWWLSPVAFQKAILWSLLFEGVGLGCGSGPLTGRYLPPIGGALYFLRPGTLRLATFPRAPLLGGDRRTLADVALYAALLTAIVLALVAPVVTRSASLGVLVLAVLVGLRDRTVWLALRAEHYVVTVACFAATDAFVAGAKSVQLALWFWAGVSKLNHHFPAVVCVMTSNSPFTRFAWLRRLVYRGYPDDLSPSRLAVVMAHVGTALELGVPIAFAVTPVGVVPWVAVGLMLVLHGFIMSNVPMGVPLEWNVVVVYGGFALFFAHPEVPFWALGPWPLALVLLVSLVAVPLVGNLWPSRVSFLLSMRYYAGNWAYGVWLFRGDASKKLATIPKSAPGVYEQLARLYDRATSVGLVSKVMGFRLMHLHGRALRDLLPRAVPNLADYEYLDGEIVGGLLLGWNFGDGHLHNERLLTSVQRHCGYEPGELRCIFVEPQALGGRTLAYRIVDAATGPLEAGELSVDELRAGQPWARAGAGHSID